MTTVSVQEHDYLDQDPPLRGQNYVCLSFLSPEDVIKRKDVFMFEKFLNFFSTEMKEFFSNLSLKYKEEIDIIRNIQERYPYVFDTETIGDEYNYFVNKNGADLDSEYLEKNNFQTTLRGIKVRGTFETMREAEVRAQVLKKLDNKFHVYVAEVGCWCPWSPNPDEITSQEFAETQLNTLMKGYKDNLEKRDVFYQERKNELASLKPERNVIEEEASDPWMQKQEVSEHVDVVTDPIEAIDTQKSDSITEHDNKDDIPE
jgi:hypothetical protein